MVEGIEGGGPFSGPRTGSASEPAAVVEAAGDRRRFKVDLHPGKTTIVSWKKLLRDAKENKPVRLVHKLAMPGAHSEDMPFRAAPEASMKMKRAGTKITEDSLGLLDGGAIRKVMDVDGQKPKGKRVKLKIFQLMGQKGKKVALIPGKEVSNVRPKTATLENAIREFEMTDAKSRLPSTEVQVPDNTSQRNKKRLTPEMKKKLAIVAKIAYSIYGKIPMDLIKRLMDIIGHLMQIRALKRNLKDMFSMGLSAEKEKDDRIEKMKQEIAEMVKQRIPYMKSNVEQEAANGEDFQEAGPDEKKDLKRKYSMDDELGNKICNLHDFYVERVEGELGQPFRRLYQELVGFWPSGFMDIDGIRRAIYRAKVLGKGLCSFQRVKAWQIREEKPYADVCLTSARNSVPSACPNPVVDVDRPNQEKGEGSNNNNSHTDAMPSNLVAAKNVKKLNPDKVVVSKANQRPNHHNRVSNST